MYSHPRKKSFVRHVGTLLLTGLLMTGCSNSTDQGNPGQASSPVEDSWAPDPNEESEIEKEEAERKAQEAAARKKLDAFAQKVERGTSVDDRLSVIVTEYCQSVMKAEKDPEDGGVVETPFLAGLDALFDKYWKSGGRWNSPLADAATQRGGCPRAFDVGRY